MVVDNFKKSVGLLALFSILKIEIDINRYIKSYTVLYHFYVGRELFFGVCLVGLVLIFNYE